MWENVGIAREERGLRAALREIEEIEEASKDLQITPQISYNKDILHAIELKHMLKVARMITESALMRQETRGAHLRLDFREKDEENWRRNIIISKNKNKMQFRTEVVKTDVQ